jgi:hypothetical protein
MKVMEPSSSTYTFHMTSQSCNSRGGRGKERRLGGVKDVGELDPCFIRGRSNRTKNRNDVSFYSIRQEMLKKLNGEGRTWSKNKREDKSKNKTKRDWYGVRRRKRRLALDQIWLFSKFFVAKCWWASEVLLEVSVGLGREVPLEWKASQSRMNRRWKSAVTSRVRRWRGHRRESAPLSRSSLIVKMRLLVIIQCVDRASLSGPQKWPRKEIFGILK